MTLQVYDDTHQISSGVPETVTHWQRNGIQPSRSVEVPMVTLDQVIGEYLPDLPLHLLSIDVEGMEHQVRKGLNRFYLAQEHRSLQGLFALPPNIWDGFVMASQIEQQAEIARLKAQIAQLQAR